jgi:hypothetical protein
VTIALDLQRYWHSSPDSWYSRAADLFCDIAAEQAYAKHRQPHQWPSPTANMAFQACLISA